MISWNRRLPFRSSDGKASTIGCIQSNPQLLAWVEKILPLLELIFLGAHQENLLGLTAFQQPSYIPLHLQTSDTVHW